MPYQLHLITDTHLQHRWSHSRLAEMAFEGGADVVQIRNKQSEISAEELVHLSRISRKPDQKLILNDWVAKTIEFGFDGAHVGAEDISPVEARRMLGEEKILGVTVHHPHELEKLRGLQVDYIGVGPVFGSRSKQTGLPELGLAGLSDICKNSSWPVIAIGNVTLQNVSSVLEAGAAGVAVLSAFCLADNPVDIAKKFRKILG